MQREVVTALNEVTDKINRIEIMRAQVEDLRKAHERNRALARDLDSLYNRMYVHELNYLSRTEMHSDDKWYVEKYKLYLNLVWLLGEIGGGASDVSGGAAYAPSGGSVIVFREQSEKLAAARTEFDRLMAEVAAFNRRHSGRLPAITDRLPPVIAQ
jgi:hypothetical protein